MAIEPRVLLLDEPFGALDAQVRRELRRWLREIHDATGHTTVFVTHDQEEALELADRVVVMSQGRIEQVGTADEVYDTPELAVRLRLHRRVELAAGQDRRRPAVGRRPHHRPCRARCPERRRHALLPPARRRTARRLRRLHRRNRRGKPPRRRHAPRRARDRRRQATHRDRASSRPRRCPQEPHRLPPAATRCFRRDGYAVCATSSANRAAPSPRACPEDLRRLRLSEQNSQRGRSRDKPADDDRSERLPLFACQR